MLKGFKVDGYKCLRNTEVTLGSDGFTVFLGPNGSGKSSLFSALSLARQLASEGTSALRTKEAFTRLVSGGDRNGTIAISTTHELDDQVTPISWQVRVGHPIGSLSVEEELGFDGRLIARRNNGELSIEDRVTSPGVPATDTLCSFARKVATRELSSPGADFEQIVPIAGRVADSLGPVRLVSLDPSAIAAPALVGASVDENGRGLPSQLNWLSSTRRGVFQEIEDRFRQFFPWIEEIEVPALQQPPVPFQPNESAQQPRVYLRFRERRTKVAFPASEMASGMLISLALLWLVLRPDSDQIICYDEPENSIHPYLLEKVYRLLRGAARGEFGRPPVQVLVATHSVDFVNLCEANEIRICERSDEGVRVSSVSDEKDLAEAVSNYRGAMGELWNSGALGGVPHDAKSSGSG